MQAWWLVITVIVLDGAPRPPADRVFGPFRGNPVLAITGEEACIDAGLRLRLDTTRPVWERAEWYVAEFECVEAADRPATPPVRVEHAPAEGGD